MVQHGGLIFYGGLMGASLACILYTRWKKLPLWKVADALAPSIALAQEKPTWAFPVTDKEQPNVPENNAPRSAPGSSKQYTRKQADDMFQIPDWYPNMYPPLPKIIANGNAPNVRACGSCHLPVGTGHDESAYVAALPARYFEQQMRDYRSGARKGSGSMATNKTLGDILV